MSIEDLHNMKLLSYDIRTQFKHESEKDSCLEVTTRCSDMIEILFIDVFKTTSACAMPPHGDPHVDMLWMIHILERFSKHIGQESSVLVLGTCNNLYDSLKFLSKINYRRINNH